MLNNNTIHQPSPVCHSFVSCTAQYTLMVVAGFRSQRAVAGFCHCPFQVSAVPTSAWLPPCLRTKMRLTSWPTASSCSTQTGTTTRYGADCDVGDGCRWMCATWDVFNTVSLFVCAVLPACNPRWPTGQLATQCCTRGLHLFRLQRDVQTAYRRCAAARLGRYQDLPVAVFLQGHANAPVFKVFMQPASDAMVACMLHGVACR